MHSLTISVLVTSFKSLIQIKCYMNRYFSPLPLIIYFCSVIFYPLLNIDPLKSLHPFLSLEVCTTVPATFFTSYHNLFCGLPTVRFVVLGVHCSNLCVHLFVCIFGVNTPFNEGFEDYFISFRCWLLHQSCLRW